MKNKASIWCYISGVISYIVGVVLCLSLIFIPIGIYAIIYGINYFRIAKITDSELVIVKPNLISAAIFISILAFPIGLISIIPAIMAGSNNVKVSEASSSRVEPEQGETVVAQVDSVETLDEEEPVTMSNEDLAKLEKLAKFKEQGLITEAEFNDAKEKLIKKD